jgi:hypothetical protein
MKNRLTKTVVSGFMMGIMVLIFAHSSMAENQAELAKKLANPIASMISVPFQLNYDKDYGPDDEGSKWVLNIQPVIPFSIGDNWNIITRTILPVIDTDDLPAKGMGESGLGDIVASQFFSPKALSKGGWTWGVGPVWLLPTATDDTLGGEKFGIGPTGVALKQQGSWTYGMLTNHIWSVAGDDDRADISSTLMQPFLAYVTGTHTTFSLNTESTYDWENEEWSVPVNFSVAQMLKLGRLPVQISLGGRYWADTPENGPEGFGGRFQFTFIFPKFE